MFVCRIESLKYALFVLYFLPKWKINIGWKNDTKQRNVLPQFHDDFEIEYFFYFFLSQNIQHFRLNCTNNATLKPLPGTTIFNYTLKYTTPVVYSKLKFIHIEILFLFKIWKSETQSKQTSKSYLENWK